MMPEGDRLRPLKMGVAGHNGGLVLLCLFDDDGDEVECEYNCEINELEPDLKLYDENLVRMSVSDYLQTLSEEESMMQKGGEE